MATYRYLLNPVPNTNPPEYESSLKLTERPIYGSSRIGSHTRQMEMVGSTPPQYYPYIQPMHAPLKRYELTDHLGNVSTVITGKLLPGNGAGSAYQADVVSAQGYEAFGSLLPGRNYSSGSYRYLFQGQEHDDEMHGATGTSYNYEYRMHDARIGRFLSIDPLASKYPHNSPYAFSENRVIDGVELEGLEHAHNLLVFTNQKEGRTVIYSYNADKVKKNANTIYVMTVHNVQTGKSATFILTRAQFYDLADELGVIDQLPDRSIKDWWADETMGTKKFRDYPSPENVDMDATRPDMGTAPEEVSRYDGVQDPQVGKSKPSLYDRYIGKDFDQVQEGDTFWMPVPDPIGGSYPQTYRKDSTDSNGYGVVRPADNKAPKDYTKVKPSTAP